MRAANVTLLGWKQDHTTPMTREQWCSSSAKEFEYASAYISKLLHNRGSLGRYLSLPLSPTPTKPSELACQWPGFYQSPLPLCLLVGRFCGPVLATFVVQKAYRTS